MNSMELKYGCNPNQKPARVFMKDGQDLPFTVLNGRPGYINLLDAFNSWQLVRELREATGLPAAARGNAAVLPGKGKEGTLLEHSGEVPGGNGRPRDGLWGRKGPVKGAAYRRGETAHDRGRGAGDFLKRRL